LSLEVPDPIIWPLSSFPQGGEEATKQREESRLARSEAEKKSQQRGEQVGVFAPREILT
jgi:hypothetical protein